MSTPELKPWETPRTDAIPRRGPFHHYIVDDVLETCRKLESALNAAREAIENAPHESNCALLIQSHYHCTCWKAAALAQISPQQSKTT